MKEHRKAFHHKRGRLLVLKQSWATPFGVFRRFFQNRKNVLSPNRWYVKSAGCLKKQAFHKGVSIPQRKSRPTQEGICARGKDAFKHRRVVKNHRSGRSFCNSSFRRVVQSRRINKPLKTSEQVNNGTEKHLSPKRASNNLDNKNVSSLEIKKEISQTPKSDNEGDSCLVILKSLKKNPSHILKQKCFVGLWLSRTCNLFSRGKVPLFMMHKKLSVFTVRGRLQSQKLRARNRSFKLEEISQPWIQKVFWKGCRKSLKSKVYKAISYLKSTIQRPVQYISRVFDMNNNTSRILCESQQRASNSCLKDDPVRLENAEGQLVNVASSKHTSKSSQQQLHGITAQSERGECLSRKTSDVPALNSYHDDVYILLTEKEVSISCQEDTDTQAEEGDELMLLAPDKLKVCTNENAGYEENIPMDVVENGEDSCHLNAEESTNSEVCNTKLLDHPYCKSPPDGSTPEKALDAIGKQGVKNGKKIISCVPDEQLASCLFGLLNEIIKKYGSLIPLSEKDVLSRLKEVFNEDFSSRTTFISKEIMKYRAKHSKATVCNFRVFYNKHMLDMDDLATLDGQNWLNDQVINMYGELIMDAVPDKVHFLNSFFHRQLVTKGYNGVKRWTKKVDFFKKSLLLIPIHLEVHWSLITVNIPNKIISFYDSQGIHFKFCVENIRKYLLTEAREKNHPEFLQGWQTAVTKCIPQQKNDSDCGVFVLQYCKCLALEQPFQFSQEDMPRVRKRIYKELVECRLMD
ncbi:sentrin-specific protease 5 [Pelodytes ibericus]